MAELDSASADLPLPRVVIADDNDLVRDVVSRILNRRGGMDVVAACRDGSEAVRACIELLPDVALLDLRMPRITGLDAIPLVREGAPDVRIIVLSGSADPGDRDRALSLGASGYVVKQADAGEIITAIQCVMRGETYVSGSVTT